jgi:hypothetical protein
MAARHCSDEESEAETNEEDGSEGEFVTERIEAAASSAEVGGAGWQRTGLCGCSFAVTPAGLAIKLPDRACEAVICNAVRGVLPRGSSGLDPAGHEARRHEIW